MRAYRWWFVACVGLGGLIGGIVGYHAHPLYATDWPAASGWAAAIGTFFLGVVALWPIRDVMYRRRVEQLSALQYAQFVLNGQLMMLDLIRQHSLDDLRSDPNRHLKLTAMDMDAPMPTLDCPQLAFLLSSGEPLLLPNAYKAESQTVTALSALRDRNRVSRGHRDAQIASGSQTATLNDQQIEHLRVLTNDLYRSVDDGVELLLRSLKGITAYIDREFPEKTRLPVNWEAVQLSPPTGSGNSAEQ